MWYRIITDDLMFPMVVRKNEDGSFTFGYTGCLVRPNWSLFENVGHIVDVLKEAKRFKAQKEFELTYLDL